MYVDSTWLRLAAAFLFLSSCSPDGPNIIGVVVDRSGASQAIGRSVVFGVQFARERLPKFVGDTVLDFRVEDDHGDPVEAKKRAFIFASDPRVLAVIGHSTSGTTLEALSIYARYKVPLLMPVATNPDISSTAFNANWNNTIRLVPTDDLQSYRIAEFAKSELNATTAVVVFDRTRYGRVIGEFVQRTLKDQGLKVLESIETAESPSGDYVAVSNSVRTFNPDVVIFAGYYDPGALIVRHMRRAGIAVPIVATDGCYQDEFLTNVGPAPGDVFVMFVGPEWAKFKSADDLHAEFQRRIGRGDPSYAPFAYDAAQLVAEAIIRLQSEGVSVNRTTLMNTLRTSGSLWLEKYGINGPYKFNERGDNVLGNHYVFKVEARSGGGWRFTELRKR